MFGRGSMKPHPTPAHLSAWMNQAREYLPATATSGLARSVTRNASQATPFKALSLSINAEQSVSAHRSQLRVFMWRNKPRDQLAVNRQPGAHSGQFKRGHKHDYAVSKGSSHTLCRVGLLASRAGMLVFRQFRRRRHPASGRQQVCKQDGTALQLGRVRGRVWLRWSSKKGIRASAANCATGIAHLCRSLFRGDEKNRQGSRRARQGCEVPRSWMASPRRYSHGHWSLGRLNPRSVTARRSASGIPHEGTKMETVFIDQTGQPIPEQRRLIRSIEHLKRVLRRPGITLERLDFNGYRASPPRTIQAVHSRYIVFEDGAHLTFPRRDEFASREDFILWGRLANRIGIAEEFQQP